MLSLFICRLPPRPCPDRRCHNNRRPYSVLRPSAGTSSDTHSLSTYLYFSAEFVSYLAKNLKSLNSWWRSRKKVRFLTHNLSVKESFFGGKSIIRTELMVGVEVELAIENNPKLSKEAKRILHGLASSWSDVVDAKSMEVVQLKGAMTNDVYQINWVKEGHGLDRKVLVRVYGKGTDIFFNRSDEIRTFECMSNHGQGPQLLSRFTNGRVEEFIHAKTLSAADIRDPEISSYVATKLREFHDIDMPGLKNVLIWDRMRKWLASAIDLCPLEEADEFGLGNMDKEIEFLQNRLHQIDQGVGFCHNDLQYGNIMMDEETRSLTLIDYDYAGYNPIAFDIANHFCEMAADYHTETPHVMDFDKYPDLEERKRFVQIYLTSSSDGYSNSDLNNLIHEIEKYTLASHLSWCFWGLISVKFGIALLLTKAEHVSGIDFNYKEYARQRLQQYWLTKPAILETPS